MSTPLPHFVRDIPSVMQVAEEIEKSVWNLARLLALSVFIIA
jgi:hypothetical protein